MKQEHRGAQVTSRDQKPPTLSHDGLQTLINLDVFNSVQWITGQSGATISVYKRDTLLCSSSFVPLFLPS